LSVRVYAERGLVPPGAPHTAFLEPLWGRGGDKYEDPRSPLAGRFDAWRTEGAGVLEAAPLDAAEGAVLPAGWEQYRAVPERRAEAIEYAERAHAAGVPLVVFFVSDSTEPLPLPGAHVFRTSLFRSRRGEREYVLPAFSVDVVRRELDGRLELRPWRPKPVVGFCGYAPDLGVRAWPRRAARRLLRRPPHPAYARTRACRSVLRSADVEPRLVLRGRYWAGVVGPDGSLDYDAMSRTWAEFVDNLVHSDYVLAARGGGNFSLRLYEALSCGRIPVFVDTDSVLPLEDEIDWRSLCVWLEEAELPELGARVAAVHAELGPDGFAERQRECRRVYEQHLSPERFFRSLAGVVRTLEP
jgi:hypothetical protein